MARIISITSPAEKTDAIIQELKGVDGKYEIHVFRQASVEPPGDIIKVAVPNIRLQQTMRLLDGFGLGREKGRGAPGNPGAHH